jgi:hypothetical protein
VTVIDARLATRLLTLLALAAPPGLCAQASPLVLEVRGGGAIPVSSFAEGARVGEGAVAAPSFGVAFVLAGQGRRALYGGFSQHRFGCEKAGCAADGQYVATGFDLGFRFDLRSSGAVVPWVRLGAITTRVELPAVPGAQEGVSELGIGGEVGAGLYVGVNSPVALVPGVRLAAVNTELPGGEILRMRYVVLDVALALAF